MDRICIAAAAAAMALTQTASAFQPRFPEAPPIIDQPLEFTLPPILGDDPHAAKVWITPVLHFGLTEPTDAGGGGFPGINWPDLDRPSDGDTGSDDSLPRIPSIPGYAGPGRRYLPSNLSRIYVINPSMNDAAGVSISCYNQAGQSVPSLSSNEAVNPRAFYIWSPPDESRAQFFWCAVSATEQVVAHGMNRRGDYIDFTPGGN